VVVPSAGLKLLPETKRVQLPMNEDMKLPRKWIVTLVVFTIIAIGFELRVQAALETDVDRPLRADAGQYFLYAYNLKLHGVYTSSRDGYSKKQKELIPDAVRPPGYPLFLAIFVDRPLTTSMYYEILITQSVLSTITIFLAFTIFQKLLGFWPATLVAFLTALSPHLISLSAYILTETLFAFVLVLAFSVFFFVERQHTCWNYLLCGLAIGAASLVRPSLQYFIIVLATLPIISFGFREGGRFAAVLLVGAGLISAPWHIRNLHAVGSFSNNMLKIGTLHHGIYPDFKYRENPRSYGYPYRSDPRSAEISKNLPSVLTEIRRRFSSEPLRHFKWYLLHKPLAFWSWNSVGGVGDVFIYPVRSTPYTHVSHFRWTHSLMKFLHWPLVILGFVGVILVWVPRAVILLDENQKFLARAVSLLLLYNTLLHMVGLPLPRYSIPLRPFMYGMACITIVYILQQIIRALRTARS
jgi:4-amino-4-deoxy-L-arabinose transferase-like glycosyltransferase